MWGKPKRFLLTHSIDLSIALYKRSFKNMKTCSKTGVGTKRSSVESHDDNVGGGTTTAITSSTKKQRDATMIEPVIPLACPFTKNSSLVDKSLSFVIYMAIREDRASSFAKGLALCQRHCAADNIHQHCFQRDQTRHVTLWIGELTFQQAAAIRFVDKLESKKQEEPIQVNFSGVLPWRAGVYLQVRPDTRVKLEHMLDQCQGIPEDNGDSRKCDHLSLYRKRGFSGHQNVYREFALVRKAVATHDWGSVEGVSIRIKPMGTDYDVCRVLWSVE